MDTRDLPALVPPSDPLDLSQPPESKTSGRGVLERGTPHRLPAVPRQKPAPASPTSLLHLWPSSALFPTAVFREGDSGETADFGEGPLADGAKPWRKSPRALATSAQRRSRLCHVGVVCVCARAGGRACTLADGAELLTCGYGR